MQTKIPQLYEAQIRTPGHRMCGAAALVMAYRRQGIEADQQQIWQQIAHHHRGHFRAHTFHLAQHAIAQGMLAAIIQTHQPWKLLRACWTNNISTILNHRIDYNRDEGHYSLLAGIDEQSIWLHDPLLGPSKKYSREDLLSLWLPCSQQSEIAGNVLIAITDPNVEPSIWAHCNKVLPATTQCPRCENKVELRPALAFGCDQHQCPYRMWYQIFCPKCDCPIRCVEKMKRAA